MYITGRNPVFEAIRCAAAKKIYVRHGASVHFDKVSVPFEVLGRSVFEEKFGEETQGVAALIDDFQYLPLNNGIKGLENEKGVVLLDRIQDPHNFGAIIRAAHCFGIKNIIVPRHEQAKVSPAVYKASAGAIFYSNVIEAVNLGQAADALKEKGFFIIAAEMEGGETPKGIKPQAGYPIGVIIGSEGKGIRESVLARADGRVSIPMEGNIDSLNAAMSAAVILYELFSE